MGGRRGWRRAIITATLLAIKAGRCYCCAGRLGSTLIANQLLVNDDDDDNN